MRWGPFGALLPEARCVFKKPVLLAWSFPAPAGAAERRPEHVSMREGKRPFRPRGKTFRARGKPLRKREKPVRTRGRALREIGVAIPGETGGAPPTDVRVRGPRCEVRDPGSGWPRGWRARAARLACAARGDAGVATVLARRRAFAAGPRGRYPAAGEIFCPRRVVAFRTCFVVRHGVARAVGCARYSELGGRRWCSRTFRVSRRAGVDPGHDPGS